MANKKSGRNSSRNAAPPAANAPPTTAASAPATSAPAAASAPKNTSVPSDLDNMRDKLGITPSMVMYSSTDLHLTFVEALYDCILYELALKKGLHQQHRNVAARYAQIQIAFAYATAPLMGWRDDLYYSVLSSRMSSSPGAVEAFARTTSALRVKGLYPFNRQAYVKKRLTDLGYEDEHTQGYVAVDTPIELSEYIASDGEEDARSLSDDQHLGYFTLPRLSKDHQQIFHQRYISMVPKEYHDPIAVIVLTLRRIWGSTGANAPSKESKPRLVKRDRFGVEEYTEGWTQKYASKHKIMPAPSPQKQATVPPILQEVHEVVTTNGSLDQHAKDAKAKNDQPSPAATAVKERHDSPSPPPSSPLVSTAKKDNTDSQMKAAASTPEKKHSLPAQSVTSNGSGSAALLPPAETSSPLTPASKQPSDSQSPLFASKQPNESQSPLFASKQPSEPQSLPTAIKRTDDSKPSSGSQLPMSAPSNMVNGLQQQYSTPTSKDKHHPQPAATSQMTKDVQQPPAVLSSGKNDSLLTEPIAPKQVNDSQPTQPISKAGPLSQPSLINSIDAKVAPLSSSTSRQVSGTQAPPSNSMPLVDISLPADPSSAAKQSQQSTFFVPATLRLVSPTTDSLPPATSSLPVKQSQQSTSFAHGTAQLASPATPSKDKAIVQEALQYKNDTQQTSSISDHKAKGETALLVPPQGSGINALISPPKASEQTGGIKLVPTAVPSKGSQGLMPTAMAVTKTATVAATTTMATATTTMATATTTTTTATAAPTFPIKKAIAPSLSKLQDEASPDNAPAFYSELGMADFSGPNPSLGLCKLKLNGLTRIQFYKILSDQADSVLPDAKTVANHAELLALLRKTLDRIYPGPQSRVLSFGSYCNGLLMNDSDADFCIAGDSRTSDPPLADMMILGMYLEDMGMEEIQVVDQATVPIVKFVDPQTKLKGDINYGNRLGVVNSEMIKMYTEIDVRCKKLLYLVKLLCRRHGINDSSKGTLSSYALNMMGITFLQNQNPPILPRLQAQSGSTTTRSVEYYQRNREGRMIWRSVSCTYDTDLERYRDFGKANRKSIGRLLLEFFEFYSRYYDYTGWEVSPALGAFAIQQYRGPMHSPWTPPTPTLAIPTNSTATLPGSPGSSSASANNTSTFGHANHHTNFNYGYSPRAGTGIFRVVDPFLPQRNLVGTCRGENVELVWRTFDKIYKGLSEGDLYGIL
ncbi:hypothetical protein BGZ73_002476 [Actinomortierella ambigua]|nr:hypothetical protein BGZ73_002476 [Actinomortierella ambigua]